VVADLLKPQVVLLVDQPVYSDQQLYPFLFGFRDRRQVGRDSFHLRIGELQKVFFSLQAPLLEDLPQDRVDFIDQWAFRS